MKRRGYDHNHFFTGIDVTILLNWYSNESLAMINDFLSHFSSLKQSFDPK